MTDAWIRTVSEEVGHSFDAPAVREVVHAANVMDSLRPEDKLMSLRKLERQLRVWRDTLVGGRVIRNRDTYISFLSEGEWCPPFAAKLAIFDAVLTRKVGYEETTSLEIVMAAITASPFRDLDTARRALKLGIVETAKAVVAMTPKRGMRAAALEVINTIDVHCGRQILSRMLSGIRVGGGVFEGEYHPIILAWVQKQALEFALLTAVQRGISEVAAWDELLRSWLQRVMSMLAHDGRMRGYSRY